MDQASPFAPPKINSPVNKEEDLLSPAVRMMKNDTFCPNDDSGSDPEEIGLKNKSK